MSILQIHLPLSRAVASQLRCGQQVIFTGSVITGRDAAHMKLFEIINRGEKMPVVIKDQILYYTGPCPAPPGFPVGAAGPTTSGRMDFATPALLDSGLAGMIGKGQRNQDVIAAIKRNFAPYFITYGGAGALLASKIKKCELIAFPELGAEAMYRMDIDSFPAIVAIDVCGSSIYDNCEEIL